MLTCPCTLDPSPPLEHPFYNWASLWENRLFAYAKTKSQISFAVTAKLISAFVFATRTVQSLYFLNPKFQASSRILWLCSPVSVGPGRKYRRPVFSQRGSDITGVFRGIHYFLISAPKQRLWVLVRGASLALWNREGGGGDSWNSIQLIIS